ncbi:MAG: Clp protease N-terminal domain-containing protein [Acidobacteriaceae bacterium]
MFERYNEASRRVIFFSRYEAAQLGSPYIETEHLLLGLIRQEKVLLTRLLTQRWSTESIREQIEERTVRREKVPTSVDLPLSNESKRILSYAAEEAEQLGHRHIGTEHLLLGILREENCFAAQILRERGATLDDIRSKLPARPGGAAQSVARPGGSMKRYSGVTRVDFVDAQGNIIASGNQATGTILPRPGEYVTLQGTGHQGRYRVDNIVYEYAQVWQTAVDPIHVLDKVTIVLAAENETNKS